MVDVEVVVARGSCGLELGEASLERSLEVLVGDDAECLKEKMPM